MKTQWKTSLLVLASVLVLAAAGRLDVLLLVGPLAFLIGLGLTASRARLRRLQR